MRESIRNRIIKRAVVVSISVLAMILAIAASAQASPDLKIGVFLPDRTAATISNHQAQVGRHQDIIMSYQAWGSNGGNLDAERVQWIIDNGSIPMITWEPWAWGADRTNQPDYSLSKISGGAHDAYIRKFAQSVKQVNGIVYLRPMHEMNGNWYPWAGTVNGNKPEQYVPAFRHIVDIFRQEGVGNVRWVWSPNNTGLPDWGTSSMRSYYPGDDYVDFAAVDGYNFGTSMSWSRWTSFDDVFGPAYRTITAFTQKPIIIAEMSSAEVGGDKGAWIRDAYSKLKTSYPKISAAIWFNESGETDWRIESTAKSLLAYKEALRAPLTAPPTAPPTTPPAPPGNVVPVDRVAPTGSVLINGGAARTRSRRVVLGLAGVDTGGSGLRSVRLKNGAGAWGPWRKFTTTTTWVLSPGRGAKRVYLQLKDGMGNASPAYTDSIRFRRAR